MNSSDVDKNRQNTDQAISDNLSEDGYIQHSIHSLVIVLPVYNEEDIIEQASSMIVSKLSETTLNFRLLFVDDGSHDKTLSIIKTMSEKDNRIQYISFSRNFGKEAAILAGISEAGDDFDALMYMDSDGQHSPNDVLKIIDVAEKTGAEIVFGARVDRNYQTFLQRGFANLFYSIFHKVSKEKIEKGVGDFNLLRPRAVSALRNMREDYPFMKGLISWVGFHRETVAIEIQDRPGGVAKSSTLKMLSLALGAILSFSAWPLRAWSLIGVFSALLALSYLIFVVIQTSINGKDIPGYATIVVLLLGIGGLQLLSVGILGEYISRIYESSKNRPRYIISEKSDEL